MVLDKYISDLLYRYECVIVPGFGGFITNKISARNISSQHKFFPPTKEIAFNKNLDTNDGLLANYLVQAKKISYAHALEIIENSVADWNTLLEEDNTFDIKKVGSFKLNEDKKLEFTPEEDVNYLTESYGLSSVTSLAVKRAGEKVKVKQLNYDDSANSLVSIRKYVRYAAIIIPFIAIGALSYYQINTNSLPVNNASVGIDTESKVIEQPTIKVENKAENTAKVVVKSEETPIAKPTVKSADVSVKEVAKPEVNSVDVPVKEVAKPVVENKKPLKYHVISGVFSNEENAEKNVRNLKSKGIDANIIGVNKRGLYMVAYKSFDNVREASRFKNKINAIDNKGAWIWKKTIK